MPTQYSNTFIALLCLIFLAACHQNLEKGNITSDFEEIAYYDVPPTEQPAPMPPSVSDQEIVRKLVKTGNLTFETKDVAATYQQIVAQLPRYGAYIENERQNKSWRLEYQLTIRVPSHVYDTLFDGIAQVAKNLESKSSNVEDVTERYYDLKTRLKNKKELEARYTALLQKAKTVSEILEIERNLNEVRTDIERFQGQFNYLSKQVNYSTIHILFYEVLPEEATEMPSFIERIAAATSDGWHGFVSFVVGIFAIWPFVLILAALVFWFVRRRKKKRQAKANS